MARLARLQKEKGLEETALRQLEGELVALGNEVEGLEKDYLVKRKALGKQHRAIRLLCFPRRGFCLLLPLLLMNPSHTEMFPNAAEHMGKLQTICAASAKKLMELGQVSQ